MKYQSYECRSVTARSDPIDPKDAATIANAIQKLAVQYRKLSHAQRKNANPFKNSAELHLINHPDRTTAFLYSDISAPMSPWITDFSNRIRDDVRATVLDDPGACYAGPEALKYLQLVARSTHCVIHVTNKSRFAWFLVGYAEGRKRRPIAVWKRGNESLITNYRGQASLGEFESKDELWHAIKKFISGSQ